MGRRKRPLDEWRRIGRGLQAIHEDLARQAVLVSHGYRKHGNAIVGLLDRLAEIRSDLEDEMYKDHPDESFDIFFGKGT